MNQANQTFPHIKTCPRCGKSVVLRATVAGVLDRYDCRSCRHHFVDVCKGKCEICEERKVACGDCSYCMNKLLPEYYLAQSHVVPADDVVTEFSPALMALRLKNGDYFLHKRVYILLEGQRHEITMDIATILEAEPPANL